MSDIPAPLTFVNPNEASTRYRVVLWAPSGEGKTVGAASAPGPILAVSADRPHAYWFARRKYPGKIREVRYQNSRTLDSVLEFLRSDAGKKIQTIVLDPFQHIYDRLVDQAPRRSDGEPDYQKINKRILDFLYALRDFDVNVVIVAHERLSEGKKGDGKMYPQLGGPSLINKITAESDIVAHVEREKPDNGSERYMAQLQPHGIYVCKEAFGGVLGDRRELDLTEWFGVLAGDGDDSDLPWEPPEDGEEPPAGAPTDDSDATLPELDEDAQRRLAVGGSE